MATVYLKKVASSSRSEWVSGTSYVVGDRVWIEDASMVISFTDSYGNRSHNAIRTYVCIQDTSSTNSPLTNSTDWTEAGTKEYPYHSVEGNLTDSTVSPESYLESQADRAHTSSSWGSLFSHLRRGESGYSLGKLIFLADEENPLFKITTRATFDQFETEPDPSIKRIRIILINGNIGSNANHNTDNTTFGRVNKCDFYFTGAAPSNNIIGGIYDNLSKLEFNECYFGPGSKVGYSDPTNTNLEIAQRNFLGLDKCTIDFPNHDSYYISYDGQKHSVGVRSYIKNSTIRFKRFKSSVLINNSYIDVSNFIAYADSLETNAVTYTNNPTFTENIAENFIIYVKDESTYTLDENAGSGFTGTVTKIDPQFLDDSGDYRLRPSSPLIGGLKEDNAQKASLEREYPEGKWFDSDAAAGGDGSWETPYNNYAEAIDSFTGDEAVVLIKEGQHPLQSGYWNGSAWGYSIDLPKVYSGGIKFIGMGPGSIFDTSENGISNYGAFWNNSTNNPNIRDTPFLFKDFDILMNNSVYINRGMICACRAEYINVNVTQALNLGAINCQLFDNSMASASGSGHYLKMSGCTINVSPSTNSSNTAYLVGNGSGLKQFQSCTFADLNRTTSTIDSPPDSFISSNFGSYSGSFIKDCAIYSKTTNTIHFGTSPTNSGTAYQGSLNLEIKNCAVYSTQGSISIGSNFGDDIKELDPKFVATEPHDFDLRLRSHSPLIGGISNQGFAADAVWVQPGSGTGTGTEDDAFYWSQYSDAFLAATQTASKQVVFKDGEYTWSSATLQDDNVGNSITMVAENMHKAIFTDGGSRMASSGKDPTLRFKGIQVKANDHFTWQQECHYVLDSCHFLMSKYMASLSITAKGCIFEIATGFDSYTFSSTGPVQIENCIFSDHNDRQSVNSYLSRSDSGTIKNCIFYVKNPRATCLYSTYNISLINCATQNITNPESGVSFIDNIQFVDIENKNYNLRPLSPLIGQAK